MIAVRTTTQRRAVTAAPPKSPEPSAPLVTLPDLHRLRGEVDVMASRLAEHVPVGAEVSVDAMTWKIGQDDGDGRVAFTVGPGPLLLQHDATHFEIRFSSDTRGAATTSLSVRTLIPTDGGDLSATLEGGPVSLSLLGVKEGAGGLVDVGRATVTGTAHLLFAGDRTAVTFDAQLGTRGLSIAQPRLASDVVRGIDLDVRARGAMSDAGDVRLDDFAATLGALHVAGSGTFEQKADHVGASFRFDVPSAPCQSLLDSVPTALLPVLQGTRMSGTFGARGHFAFDTRTLDDLELDYDIQDQCRIVEVPASLARVRFKQPFAHRIYLPDGSTVEQTTGPGTPSWTSLGQISPYMEVAVLTTEDGGFLHHRGFNRPSIRSSIVANLKARRFVRGASTITMQLAKNLFLSRDKTLARKLEEVVLTEYLEQTFSKDELMELYLNVIEFGPAVYGVTNAAEYYFGRAPDELTLAESLFLSSLLPSPIRYGAMRDLPQLPESWTRMLHSMMQMEQKRGLISDAELAEGQGESIVFWHGGQRPPPRPAVQIRSRLQGEGESDDVNATPLPSDPDGF
ncbi:MAG: biosynthetic peptidoglycan transglycosylase [Polyangiaceae bacterium]